MPTIYQTRDGDVLDAICAEHYGTANLSSNLSAVLEANRGLADRDATLPAGLAITLPDLSTPVTDLASSLWD